MKKNFLAYSIPAVDEKKTEETLLDFLQLACTELFPEIKRASARQCARSIRHILIGLVFKNFHA